jgi:polyisoprenoid-binding protein YceI
MQLKIFATIILLAASFAAADIPAPEEVYSVTPENSRIEFHANATFTKVIGVFHNWQANFRMPSGKVDDASLTLDIEAASVRTGSGVKDKTVKSPNFFDVEQHPTIRFVSKRVLTGPDPDRYMMEGDLTLRGVTRPVSIILAWQPGDDGARHLTGDCEFNRREFGMTHNIPFNKIADKVSVQFNLAIANASAQDSDDPLAQLQPAARF